MLHKHDCYALLFSDLKLHLQAEPPAQQEDSQHPVQLGRVLKEKAKHLLKHLTKILQLKQARALATSYIPCAMFALTCYLLRLLFF